jgi:hypothetical protein
MFKFKSYTVVFVPVKYSQIIDTPGGKIAALDTLLPEITETYWRRESFDQRVAALEATSIQRTFWSSGARRNNPETINACLIDDGKTFLAVRKLGPERNHGSDYKHEVVGEYAPFFKGNE